MRTSVQLTNTNTLHLKTPTIHMHMAANNLGYLQYNIYITNLQLNVWASFIF